MWALTGKRICVTGGAGFLGSHLVQQLQQRGAAEIFVPHRRNYDLTSMEGVKRMFRDGRPEVIFHLAAVSTELPGTAFYANLMMGLQLIDLARQFSVERVVVAGAPGMYPAGLPEPVYEGDLWEGYPQSPLGVAKRAVFEQCRQYERQYGMTTACLIPASLYGPGDRSERMIPAMIRLFLDAVESGADSVEMPGNGREQGEFLYVGDAAAGFILAAEQATFVDPCNLGGGSEVTLQCLAAGIAELCGYQGRIVWTHGHDVRPALGALDASRAEQEFGFRATVDLREGLQRTIDWYRAQRQ